MSTAVLKNGLVFSEKGSFVTADITCTNGIFTSVAKAQTEGSIIDCSGCYVIPALVDVHLHGCAGYDFCGGNDPLPNIAKYQLAHGIGAFCPATMTLPEQKLGEILCYAASFADSPKKADAADLAGIHLEGPFISPEKCGAQNPRHIIPPDSRKLSEWQDAAKGLIKLVTVAPEMEGADELIRELSGQFHFSLGHTNCSYDTALRAFELGADHVTHLFNAMPPFHHRDTGLIGAALDSPGCYFELICDGVHLSPTAVRTAFRLFGDRVVLISDSMEATGMPDGEYTLGDQQVTKKGRTARLKDGTIAGSVSDLYDCMLTAVEIGIPLEQAVAAATIAPARSVGIDHLYGSISPGKRALLLVLDKADLSIKRVFAQPVI